MVRDIYLQATVSDLPQLSVFRLHLSTTTYIPIYLHDDVDVLFNFFFFRSVYTLCYFSFAVQFFFFPSFSFWMVRVFAYVFWRLKRLPLSENRRRWSTPVVLSLVSSSELWKVSLSRLFFFSSCGSRVDNFFSSWIYWSRVWGGVAESSAGRAPNKSETKKKVQQRDRAA